MPVFLVGESVVLHISSSPHLSYRRRKLVSATQWHSVSIDIDSRFTEMHWHTPSLRTMQSDEESPRMPIRRQLKKEPHSTTSGKAWLPRGQTTRLGARILVHTTRNESSIPQRLIWRRRELYRTDC